MNSARAKRALFLLPLLLPPTLSIAMDSLHHQRAGASTSNPKSSKNTSCSSGSDPEPAPICFKFQYVNVYFCKTELFVVLPLLDNVAFISYMLQKTCTDNLLKIVCNLELFAGIPFR
ncbi:unnamed protein product [Prunus brigantina]